MRRASVWRRAGVLAACAAVLACQTRPPGQSEKQDTPPADQSALPTQAPASGPAQPTPRDQAPDQGLPPALPQTAIGRFEPASWLTGAERATVFPLDGQKYIAVAGTGWLAVYLVESSPNLPVATREVARAEAPGAAHVLEYLGADERGQALLAVGRGLGREARDAAATAVIQRFDGRTRSLSAAEPIVLPQGERAQVIAMIPRDDHAERFWVGAFRSKYFMELYSVERTSAGVYQVEKADSIRVALSMAAGDPDGDGELDLFIARPYGDAPDLPGDVFRRRAQGEREPLPATRGARAVAVHGRTVLMADGWDKDYGHRANALITAAEWSPGGFRPRVLVHAAGRHGYDRLAIGEVDGDGQPDLVAAGNGPAVLVRGLAPVSGAVPTLGDAEAWDIAMGDLTGDGRDEVLILGPAPGVWQLGN